MEDALAPSGSPKCCREPAPSHAGRFVPADRPGEGRGTWKQYYERSADMTLERIGREMVDLVPELAIFAPPAPIVDKRVYSPWHEPRLHAWLRDKAVAGHSFIPRLP